MQNILFHTFKCSDTVTVFENFNRVRSRQAESTFHGPFLPYASFCVKYPPQLGWSTMNVYSRCFCWRPPIYSGWPLGWALRFLGTHVPSSRTHAPTNIPVRHDPSRKRCFSRLGQCGSRLYKDKYSPLEQVWTYLTDSFMSNTRKHIASRNTSWP